MRALALSMLLFAAGCSATEIDVTVRFDADVSDATLATGSLLRYAAGGADNASGDIQPHPNRPFSREEHIVYRAAASSGTVQLTMKLFDSSMHALACGQSSIVLASARAVPADLVLHAGDCPATPVGGGMLCPAGAIVCDDFESDLAKWDVASPNGSATIDSAHPHTGAEALHIHVDGSTTTAYPAELVTLVAPVAYPIYIRAYVYIPSPRNGAYGDLAYVLSASSGVLIFGFNNGKWYLGQQNLGTSEMAGSANSLQGPPPDAYVCFEWMVDGRSGGSERVSLGGIDDPNLHVDGVTLESEYRVHLGWSGQLAPGESVDLWLDDVAIANTPSGCP